MPPALGLSRPVRLGWCVLLCLLFLSLQRPTPAPAATNSELIPGSRLVFPYYDIRFGTSTFLVFTNVGLGPATLHLEFYDPSGLRRDSNLFLSAGDINLLDVAAVLHPEADGPFQQGFVDAVTFSGDVLLGTAVIVNGVEDWGIIYHGAAARRTPSGPLPFEPYPTRLFLPAFVTQGALSEGYVTDGLLVVAAPHPTLPGGELPEPSLQAAVRVFLDAEPPWTLAASATRASESSPAAIFTSHQLIVPIGQVAGTFDVPRFGWLSVANSAVDGGGTPVGLVGLYIQTIAGDGSGMGLAIRLSGDPASGP